MKAFPLTTTRLPGLSGSSRNPRTTNLAKAAKRPSLAKLTVTLGLICFATLTGAAPTNGLASWYGEAHRGKLMANGKKFNPDNLTAASWFYPLGTKVRVTRDDGSGKSRSVQVTITDRGPATDLVRDGRIIDLAYGAFRRLGEPDLGLVPVTVRPVKPRSTAGRS